MALKNEELLRLQQGCLFIFIYTHLYDLDLKGFTNNGFAKV